MCNMEEFELEDIEKQESEAENKEAMIIKEDIETDEEPEKEDRRREFDSEVPVTI